MSEAEARVVYGRAIHALNHQRWREARQLASSLLPHWASHAGVNFVLGVSAHWMGDHRVAYQHLQEAVRRNPTRADYLAQLALLFATMRLYPQALQAAERARELDPGDPLSLDALGLVFTHANAHGRAEDVYLRAAALAPDVASRQFNLATAQMFVGKLELAGASYARCIELDPRYWRAYLARAQLRRWTADDNHVDALLRLLEQADGDPNALLHVHLALEKELYDLGQIERSFHHLQAGKHAWGRVLGYASEDDERLFEAVMNGYDAMPAAADQACPSREPIFVVGMPRSGTTLVERILSSHSAVTSAGELQNFGVQVKRLSASASAAVTDADTFLSAPRVNLAELGSAYIASTRPVTGGAPHFIDKLPHNFLYAGLIAKALPNARMICLRRDPVDTTLSNFRQLFALRSSNFGYSFDICDTARYYVLFDRLMSFWRERMPGRILEVAYEDIVDAQEAQTRRLLEHCGLAWEPACLEFERNTAPVATASVVQVRSPIYRSSMQRWRRYGDLLDAPRAILADAGISS